MAEKSGVRFIEFVIATTIGSIVGAYIARDITIDMQLVVRAAFAVALLAVFFFLVYKVSSSWAGRKKKAVPREPEEEIPADYPEEPLPGNAQKAPPK